MELAIAFRRETTFAIEAVQAAMRLARERAGADDVTIKDGRDVVTGTDVAVEDAVRAALADALGATLVGEERGGVAPEDGGAYWLMDPLCGTRNFASGVPLYCVNLALVEGGEVTAAVVGVPAADDLYAAERGRGAWGLERGAWRRLAASEETLTLVIEDGKSAGARRARCASFVAAVMHADRWDLRALGSTIGLAYLAAGRISGYSAFLAGPVHAAAGVLVASEAGATVTDVDGAPWTVASDSVFASATPELHAELMRLTLLAPRASPG